VIGRSVPLTSDSGSVAPATDRVIEPSVPASVAVATYVKLATVCGSGAIACVALWVAPEGRSQPPP